MSSGVVLLAAGSSHRFRRSVPKQFISLNGEPLFMKSLRVFASLSSVKEIAVVCQPSSLPLVRRWVKKLKSRGKSILIVKGGAYRGQSVRNGVLALTPLARVILVHDSARPLVSAEVVRRVERAAKKVGAAIAAWPVSDTLKLSSPLWTIRKTVPRRRLWSAQTPQGFRRDVALKCLLTPSITATDDAELAERRGFKVTLVPADAANLKVTYPHDLAVCRALINR